MVSFGTKVDFTTSGDVATCTSNSNSDSMVALSTTTTCQKLDYYYQAVDGDPELLYSSTQSFPITAYFGMHSCVSGIQFKFTETENRFTWTLENDWINGENACDTWFFATNCDDYAGYDASYFRFNIESNPNGSLRFRIRESDDWGCTSSCDCGSTVSKYVTGSNRTVSEGDQFYVQISGSVPGTSGTRLPPPPLIARF